MCVTLPSTPLLCLDHRPPHAACELPAQRGVHPRAPHGRAPHRRADAVQSRRETLPRPLLRQQAQLVRVCYLAGATKADAGLCEGRSVSLCCQLIIILSWLRDISCQRQPTALWLKRHLKFHLDWENVFWPEMKKICICTLIYLF